MSDLSAEERAQQLVGGNSWWKSDPWNLDVEFGNPPEVDEARLVQLIAAAIRDAASDAAGQERARVLRVVKDASYDPVEMYARENGDEYYAGAGFEQARQVIYAAIRALPAG
jgi:hypothetical protein